MKRRVRVYRPCPECGASIDHSMEQGGAYLPVVDQDHLHQAKSGGDWIQKATKSIKKKGTEGRCTGSKFGGPDCPKGSRQYNLAVTFRNMAKANKRQFGGTSTADQNTDVTSFGKERMDYFKNHIADQASRIIAEEEYIGAGEDAMEQAFQKGGGTQADWGSYGYKGNPQTDLLLDTWENQQNQNKEAVGGLFGAMASIRYDQDHYKFETKFNPNKPIGPDNQPSKRESITPNIAPIATPGHTLPNSQNPNPNELSAPIDLGIPSSHSNDFNSPKNRNMNLPKNKFGGLHKMQPGGSWINSTNVSQDMQEPWYKGRLISSYAQGMIPEGGFNKRTRKGYYDKNYQGKSDIFFPKTARLDPADNKDAYFTDAEAAEIERMQAEWNAKKASFSPNLQGPVNLGNISTSNQSTVPTTATTTSDKAQNRLNAKTLKSGTGKTATSSKGSGKLSDADIKGTGTTTEDKTTSTDKTTTTQSTNKTNSSNNPYTHVSQINYRRAFMPGNRMKNVIFHHHVPGQGGTGDQSLPGGHNMDYLNPGTKSQQDNTTRERLTGSQATNIPEQILEMSRETSRQYGGDSYHEPYYNVGPDADLMYDQYGRPMYAGGGSHELSGSGNSIGKGINWEDQDATAGWKDPWGSEKARTKMDHHMQMSGQGKLTAAGQMVGPAIDFAAMIGRKMTEPDWQQKIENSTSAENVFSPMAGDRGFNTFNKIGYDPGTQGTPVQFKGMARRGGALTQMFEEGGSYELTEEEIENFMRAGGQIEYVD